MESEQQEALEHFIQENLGVPLSHFLNPISGATPAGPSFRENSVYHAIKEARREDDANLPLGVWVHELKRADWAEVSRIAKEALVSKTKDLQIAVWLLEAEIHQHGFAGVAPCMVVLHQLCVKFWNDLHPQIRDNDLEFRVNPLVWANEKLLPVLRLIPITAAGREQGEMCWNDYEMAQRYEKIRAQTGVIPKDKRHVTLQEFMSVLAATPTEYFLGLMDQLTDALATIHGFKILMDELCKEDAPGFKNLLDLLADIQASVAGELQKRGIVFNERGEIEDDGEGGGGSGGGEDGGGTIRSRAHAYARLAEAAEYLMRIEPHSPAPYLVKRAIEWGNMNTAELYRDLFVRVKGQLDIFELLGIENKEKE